MRCEDLADRLTDFMEGDLDAEEESAALEHLASCESCERVLAETRDVVSLAAEHGRPELTAKDRARMFSAITSEMADATEVVDVGKIGDAGDMGDVSDIEEVGGMGSSSGG